MNEYVLILVWFFVLFLFTRKNYRQEELDELKIKKYYSKVIVVCVCIPLIYWATFRSDAVGDTYTYKTMLNAIPSSFDELGSFFVSNPYEKGFAIYVCAIKKIFGNEPQWIFFFTSLISIGCLSSFYRKYSVDYLFSMFIFVVSAEYLAWILNGMRQFMAVAIIYGAIGFFLNKKYIRFVIAVLIASTIHISALLMLPMIFIIQGEAWNRKTVVYLLLSLIAMFFSQRLIGILGLVISDTKYSGMTQYMSWERGTSILRVLVYSIPVIISFIYRDKIKEQNNVIINMAVNMSIISLGLYNISIFTSGIFIGRLPIYFSLFNYVLLPVELEYLIPPEKRKILLYGCVFFYLVFYFSEPFIALNVF